MMMGGFITLSQMGLPVKVIILNKMERLALLNWRWRLLTEISHRCPLRVQKLIIREGPLLAAERTCFAGGLGSQFGPHRKSPFRRTSVAKYWGAKHILH